MGRVWGLLPSAKITIPYFGCALSLSGSGEASAPSWREVSWGVPRSIAIARLAPRPVGWETGSRADVSPSGSCGPGVFFFFFVFAGVDNTRSYRR